MAHRQMTLNFDQPQQFRNLYKLTRGKILPEFIEINQLRDIVCDTEALVRLDKLCALNEGRDNSGIFYRVIFRTNKSITLHSLGFWGPQTEAIGEYRVKIVISKLSTPIVAKQKSTQLREFLANVQDAKKRQIFFVQLDKPLPIVAGTWTEIEFLLKGPPTAQSENLMCDCQGEGGVNFDFSHQSSRQLPVMKYEIG